MVWGEPFVQTRVGRMKRVEGGAMWIGCFPEEERLP